MRHRQVYLRLGILLAALAIAAALLAFAGQTLFSIFLPFSICWLLAWLLNPFILYVQRKLKIKRKIISFILTIMIYSGVIALITVFISELIVQISALSENWQAIWNAIQATLHSVIESLRPPGASAEFDAMAAGVIDTLLNFIWEGVSSIFGSVMAWAGGIALKLPTVFIFITVLFMGSYFIISDYEKMNTWLRSHTHKGIMRGGPAINRALKSSFAGFFKAQFKLGLITFVIVFVYLFVFGFDYALVLSVITFILDFIPAFGAGVLLVPWLLVSFISGNAHSGLLLLVLYIVVTVMHHLLEPRVLGGKTGLSPLMTLVSMYAGMVLAGGWGLIFGPVLAVVFLRLYRAGVFDSLAADIKVLIADISAAAGGYKK